MKHPAHRIRAIAGRTPGSRRAPGSPGSRAAGGFTLMEVLVAAGIFALGSIAVASIFPVAILLQRRTVEATHADAFTDSAVALVEARGFDEDLLENTHATITPTANNKAPDVTVHPVPEAVNGNSPTNYEFAALDRSYGVNSVALDRAVWWVPLFFDAADDSVLPGPPPPEATRSWKVFLFIVKADPQAVYAKPGGSGDWAVNTDPTYIPGVRKITVTKAGNRFNFTNTAAGGLLVRVGDKVLAENGSVYSIAEADNTGVRVRGNTILGTPTAIWAADPGNSEESSFVDLIELIDDDTNALNNLIR